MRKTLSVVYATFNEEKNLPASLDSLKDIADEIIIVDGTSTDKTVEIAKKYGAKIKITTNKLNFHINKQMAIDMATKDWILQMDGDEHVSEEMKEEIREILEKDPKEYNGYWMPRKNWFLGRFLMKGGQYPDYTLRFYRNGKGKLPQKDVHEQAEVEGKVGYLKSALLHYPYSNFAHYVKKWNFYNNFFANQIKEEQQNRNILQKFVDAILYLFIRPVHWLLITFIRHKGFVDGWQGFVFSLFSALRFPVSYIKYLGVYKFWSAVIIIVAAILRLYHFSAGWSIGGDNGRDAIIALEALKRHQLPLMGPFSSAGPFVFGGIFYWFIMLSYLVLPFVINAPWVFLEVVSIFNVAILIYLGKILKGEKLALIMGVLGATSPQLFNRTLALGPHTFVSTFSILALISFVLLWQKKKIIHAFLMGIWIGLALSFHYQAINLLIFFPFIFLIFPISFKKRFVAFLAMLIGFLIPSFPLLYWDSFQNFVNTRNVLDYFFIGQYRIYVPNSWKLYILNYIPTYWGYMVGYFKFTGLLLSISSLLIFLYSAFKKRISNVFVALGIIFLILLFVNRFYRGERSEGYLLYFIPFILIFSSLVFEWLLDFRNKAIKFIGLLIIVLIVASNLVNIIGTLITNNYDGYTFSLSERLSQKYPNTKFSLYDYRYKLYYQSMPLSFVMSWQGKLSPNGMKIGLNCYGKDCARGLPVINKDGVLLVDLSTVKSSDFNNKIWINVNPKTIYDDQVTWLNNYNLKSSFNLEKYLFETFKL